MTSQGRVGRVRFDLGALAFVAMLALVLLAPLQQGLYFHPELDGFAVAVAGVLALVAVDHAVRGRPLFATRPLDWVAMALALGYLIAYLHRPVVPYDALQGALRAGVLLAWYWIAAATVSSARRLSILLHTLLGSGVVLAAIGCLAAGGLLRVPAAVVSQRILSTIQYANSFGAVLVFALIIALALTVQDWEAGKPARRHAPAFNVRAAGYGAACVLLLVTLLGTTSRGAWLVLAVGAALWVAGLPRAQRWSGVLGLLWPSAVAVLLSRTILGGFWDGHGPRSLLVLLFGMAVGALGFGIERAVVQAWRRQQFAPEVRRVFQGVAGLYVLGVITFLLVSTGGATAALAGRGIVSAQVAQQAGSISLSTPDFLARVVMWRDGLKLLARQPLLGFGGGGWAALYHTVQSALYWSSQAHESVLQAWLGGGLLAAAGTAGVGICLLVEGWRRRGAGGGAPLLWGLAAAGVALWAHSLADFDLSIPAVALLLWGAAGALRGAGPVPAAPSAPPARGVAVARGLGSGVAVAAVAGLLFVAGSRLSQAGALAAAGSQAMSAKQYAQAYDSYQGALALEPLDPSVLADKAQLLTLAFDAAHSQSFRQQAADTALAAMQFGPGNFGVDATALNVLGATDHWPSVADGARAMLASFPLDPTVAALGAGALVKAGVGDLGGGDFTGAGAALQRAAATGTDLGRLYAAHTNSLAAAKFDPPALGEQGVLAEGEADAMLGRWTTAAGLLSPLLKSTSPGIAYEARIWLAAAQQRGGDPALAAATFAPLQQDASAVSARAAALRLTSGATAPLWASSSRHTGSVTHSHACIWPTVATR